MRMERPASKDWLEPATYWSRMASATADLDTPFGVISVPALASNALDMLDRAAGKPIRVATKSVRVRGVIEAVLQLPGYSGVLAYTLAEGLWLAESVTDVVVGYPTVDRASIRALGSSAELASRVTIMVDSVEQLDVVDAVLAPAQRETIRVCLEMDASWHSRLLGRLGVLRSPVRTPDQARALAEKIVSRPGFTLVGVMGYEAQIAGVTNRLPGRPLMRRTVRYVQSNSTLELAERRGAVVAAVREVADLEFVNGGGTGSIETTSADASVTEIAAGSGLFGPHLFDGYRHFSPAPAAAFALSVVRKPSADTATLLGGGWVASGPPAVDRLPQIAWPTGLRMAPREMAGEVQTPVRGPAARNLGVGDRVWLRHTKAGELSAHVNEFALVDGDRVIGSFPTYRGERKVFL